MAPPSRVCAERSDQWLDARHLGTAIAQRAGQRRALRAVVGPGALAAIVATAPTVVRRTRRRPTQAPAAVELVGAGADPAAAQDRAGPDLVRRLFTRLPRCGRSPQCAKAWKSGRPLTSVTSFSVTPRTIAREPQRSCTICSKDSASRSGSARKTWDWGYHCSVPSTKGWRIRVLGSCSLPLHFCVASRWKASPTRSCRRYSRVSGSCPWYMRRHTTLSAKSAPCSPREAA